jgi:hypothetical protein
MAIYSTRVHGPADEAPGVTERFAHCQVCGAEWQIRSETEADAEGCSFCDAPAGAVTVLSERPDYGGVRVRVGR